MQIIGRAARNVNGKVHMYSHGKKISIAMEAAIGETNRRRAIQEAYNTEHGITPTTIVSSIKEIGLKGKKKDPTEDLLPSDLETHIKRLELEMDIASANLDFELAAELRDDLIAAKRKLNQAQYRR